MKLLEEKTEEQGREKHVPVAEKTDKGIKMEVGSVPPSYGREALYRMDRGSNG